MNYTSRYRRGRHMAVLFFDSAGEVTINYMGLQYKKISNMFDDVPNVDGHYILRNTGIKFFISSGKRRSGKVLKNKYIETMHFTCGILHRHPLKRS